MSLVATIPSAAMDENKHEPNTTVQPQCSLETRIEPVPKNGFPHEKYPRWIGHKFDPDGRLLPFPGNTLICHLPSKSTLLCALRDLNDELQHKEFASLYALLPPTSWHMTIFEGVSDQIRKPGCWPGDLSLEAPLESCTSLIKQRLEHFDLGIELPFRMTIDGWEDLEDGIALKVVPASSVEEERLRDLRDRLSQKLQIRYPGHHTYSFHVSLAYMLRYLDDQIHDKVSTFLHEALCKLPKSFELDAPEFCTFTDMFAFRRHFFLSRSSEA